MASQDPKKFNFSVGALVFLVIAFSGYLAIGDLVGEQSRQQQQSVSPVFALIENELTAPLHIAKTLSDAGIFDKFFALDAPDESQTIQFLKQLQDKFEYEFYLAHDKARRQFNSDGRAFDLIEGEVIWYFTLKNEFDSEVQAVLGNRDDIHLYIDVRQYDEEGKFIGFVGVGKSLKDFISSFERFREKYGHEFIFVNNRNQIVLSSLEHLAPTQAQSADGRIGIKTIDNVPWYPDFLRLAEKESEGSALVESERGDLLVSQLELQNLNWQLFLVTPLNTRQAEANIFFAIYIAIALLIILVVYKLFSKLYDRYQNARSRRKHQDSLTTLPTKEHAILYFNQQCRQFRQMALMLLDLDDFQKFNLAHGHLEGDKVIKRTAELLESTCAKSGLCCRLKDESFVVVMPDFDLKPAKDLAEKMRVQLEHQKHKVADQSFVLTASIGVYASRQYSDTLEVMLERADRAMHQAKAKGKNQVESFI